MFDLGALMLSMGIDDSRYYASLEKARQSTIKVATEIESKFTKLDLEIRPRVDHRPLTELNQHLDRKAKHVDTLNRSWASSPLKIKIDDSELDNIPLAVKAGDSTVRLTADPDLASTIADAIEGATERGVKAGMKAAQGNPITNMISGGVGALATGFLEKGGQRFSEGIGFGQQSYRAGQGTRKAAQTVNREVLDVENSSAAFLAELLRSGSPAKAAQSGYEQAPIGKAASSLQRMMAIATMDIDNLDVAGLAQSNPKVFSKIQSELKGRGGYAKYAESPEALEQGLSSNRGVKVVVGRILADELKSAQDLVPRAFIDNVINPVLATLNNPRAYIGKIQGYRAEYEAKQMKHNAIVSLPDLQDGESGMVQVIGGAQFRKGEGRNQIAPWAEGLFPDRRVIGVANPDTDPSGQVNGPVGQMLKSLAEAIAPDIKNNQDLSNTVANAIALLQKNLNPAGYSETTSNALANILAAQDAGIDPANFATMSYSLGGANAKELAEIMQRMGIQSPVHALAYPDFNPSGKKLDNFEASLIEEDPLSFIKNLLMIGGNENQKIYKAGVAPGMEAHSPKHYFKNQDQVAGFYDSMGVASRPESAGEGSAHFISAAAGFYEMIGSLMQSEAIIKTGKMDPNLPTKGFLEGDKVTGENVMFKSAESLAGLSMGNTSSMSPEQQAIVEGLHERAAKVFGQLVEKYASDFESLTGKSKSNIAPQDVFGSFQLMKMTSKTDAAYQEMLGETAPTGEGYAAGLDKHGLLQQAQVLKDEIKWFGSQTNMGDSKAPIIAMLKQLREVMLEYAETGQLSQSTKAEIAKTRPGKKQLSAKFEQVLNQSIDPNAMPAPDDAREYKFQARNWARETPEAVVAYNKIARSMRSAGQEKYLPGIQGIETAAYGMSGAASLLSEDYVYKTDVNDPEKIASDQEVAAYQKLSGRFSPMLYGYKKGEFLVAERLKGQSAKDMLEVSAAPVRERQSALDKLTAEITALKQVKRANGKDGLSAEDQEREKALQAEAANIRRSLREAKAKFNDEAEAIYEQIGRLAATFQSMGVAHMDLAAGNVFFGDDGIQAIDFGRSVADPTEQEKGMDILTAQQRMVFDNSYWGMMDFGRQSKAISRGVKAGPLPAQPARTAQMSDIPEYAGQKEVELGSTTPNLMEQFIGDYRPRAAEIRASRATAAEEKAPDVASTANKVNYLAMATGVSDGESKYEALNPKRLASLYRPYALAEQTQALIDTGEFDTSAPIEYGKDGTTSGLLTMASFAREFAKLDKVVPSKAGLTKEEQVIQRESIDHMKAVYENLLKFINDSDPTTGSSMKPDDVAGYLSFQELKPGYADVLQNVEAKSDPTGAIALFQGLQDQLSESLPDSGPYAQKIKDLLANVKAITEELTDTWEISAKTLQASIDALTPAEFDKKREHGVRTVRHDLEAGTQKMGWDFGVDRGLGFQNVSLYDQQGQVFKEVGSMEEAVDIVNASIKELRKLETQYAIALEEGNADIADAIQRNIDSLVGIKSETRVSWDDERKPLAAGAGADGSELPPKTSTMMNLYHPGPIESAFEAMASSAPLPPESQALALPDPGEFSAITTSARRGSELKLLARKSIEDMADMDKELISAVSDMLPEDSKLQKLAQAMPMVDEAVGSALARAQDAPRSMAIAHVNSSLAKAPGTYDAVELNPRQIEHLNQMTAGDLVRVVKSDITKAVETFGIGVYQFIETLQAAEDQVLGDSLLGKGARFAKQNITIPAMMVGMLENYVPGMSQVMGAAHHVVGGALGDATAATLLGAAPEVVAPVAEGAGLLAHLGHGAAQAAHAAQSVAYSAQSAGIHTAANGLSTVAVDLGVGQALAGSAKAAIEPMLPPDRAQRLAVAREQGQLMGVEASKALSAAMDVAVQLNEARERKALGQSAPRRMIIEPPPLHEREQRALPPKPSVVVSPKGGMQQPSSSPGQIELSAEVVDPWEARGDKFAQAMRAKIEAARGHLERAQTLQYSQQQDSFAIVEVISDEVSLMTQDLDAKLAQYTAAPTADSKQEILHLKSQLAVLSKGLDKVLTYVTTVGNPGSAAIAPHKPVTGGRTAVDLEDLTGISKNTETALSASSKKSQKDYIAYASKSIKALGAQFTKEVAAARKLDGQEQEKAAAQILASVVAAAEQINAMVEVAGGKNAPATVRKAAATARGQITRAEKTASPMLPDDFDLSADIIGGLSLGLLDRLKDLDKVTKSISNALLQGLKDNLEIRSPSRKTFYVGQEVANGLVVGFQSQIDAIGDQTNIDQFVANISNQGEQVGAAFGPALQALDEVQQQAASAVLNINAAFENIPIPPAGAVFAIPPAPIQSYIQPTYAPSEQGSTGPADEPSAEVSAPEEPKYSKGGSTQQMAHSFAKHAIEQIEGQVGDFALSIGGNVGDIIQQLSKNVFEGIYGIIDGVDDAMGPRTKRMIAGLELAVGGFIGFQVVKAASGHLLEFGMAAGQAAIEMEKLQTNLDFASGGKVAGAEAFRMLRAESDRLSVSLLASTRSYSQLTATTKGTALEGVETEQIYKGVAQGAAAYSLSEQDTELVFMAVNQMASKAVVSMEELRQQLGERLPGAMQIAARSMNMTTQEFTEMVGAGDLLAEDFLPKFARQLKAETAGAVPGAQKTTQASLNKFENAKFEVLAESGEKFLPVLKAGLDVAAGSLTLVAKNMDKIAALLEAIAIVGMARFAQLIVRVIGLDGALKGASLSMAGLKSLMDSPAFKAGIKMGITLVGGLAIQQILESIQEQVKGVGNAFKDMGGQAELAAVEAQKALGGAGKSGQVDNSNFAKSDRDVQAKGFVNRFIVDPVRRGGRNVADFGYEKLPGFAKPLLGFTQKEGARDAIFRTTGEASAAKLVTDISGLIDSVGKNVSMANGVMAGAEVSATRMQELENELKEVQSSRRTAQAFSGDQGLIDQLDARENVLQTQLDEIASPIKTVQGSLETSKEILESSFKELDGLLTAGKISLPTYEKEKARLQGSMKEVEAAQGKMAGVMVQAELSITRLSRSIEDMVNGFEDAKTRVDQAARIDQASVINSQADQSLTSGQAESQQMLISRLATIRKLSEARQLQTGVQGALQSPDSQMAMRTLGLSGREGKAELGSMVERLKEAPREKAVVEQLIRLKEVEDEISQYNLELVQSKLEMLTQLREIDKSVNQYVKDVGRQVQSINAEIKSNELQSMGAKFRTEIEGSMSGQQNLITSYVDSMLEMFDMLMEPLKRQLDFATQQQQMLNGLTDQFLTGNDLQSTLAGGLTKFTDPDVMGQFGVPTGAMAIGGAGGLSGLKVSDPSAASKVVMERTGQKDEYGLENLALKVIDKLGNVVSSHVVNSGQARTQNQFGPGGSTRSGSMAPVEYGKYSIAAPIASGIEGVGATFIETLPKFSTDRAAIGFHVDANRTYAPGSAGCIVFKTEADFDAFQKALAASGVKEFEFREGNKLTNELAAKAGKSLGASYAQMPKQQAQPMNKQSAGYGVPKGAKVITEAEAVQLATLAVLEAPTRKGRLDVVQSVMNRINAANTGIANDGFGKSVSSELFRPGQYEPFFANSSGSSIINPAQVSSLGQASSLVSRKRGMSESDAQEEIRRVISEMANPSLMTDAARHVGGRTHWKGTTMYPHRVAGEDPLRSNGENFFHIEPAVQTYSQLGKLAQMSPSAIVAQGKGQGSGGGLSSSSLGPTYGVVSPQSAAMMPSPSSAVPADLLAIQQGMNMAAANQRGLIDGANDSLSSMTQKQIESMRGLQQVEDALTQVKIQRQQRSMDRNIDESLSEIADRRDDRNRQLTDLGLNLGPDTMQRQTLKSDLDITRRNTEFQSQSNKQIVDLQTAIEDGEAVVSVFEEMKKSGQSIPDAMLPGLEKIKQVLPQLKAEVVSIQEAQKKSSAITVEALEQERRAYWEKLQVQRVRTAGMESDALTESIQLKLETPMQKPMDRYERMSYEAQLGDAEMAASLKKRIDELAELEKSEQITADGAERLRDVYLDMASMKMDGLTESLRRQREEMERTTSLEVRKSGLEVQDAQVSLNQTYGYQDVELDENIAVSRQQVAHEEAIANIDQMAMSGKYAAEQLEQMRDNATQLNNIRLEQISAQFNPMLEGFKATQSAFSGFLKDVILGTGDIKQSFKNMVASIASSMADMALKGMFNKLLGGMFNGGGTGAGGWLSMLGGLLGGAGGGVGAGGLSIGLESVLSFSDGGIVPGGGIDGPRYGGGGIVPNFAQGGKLPNSGGLMNGQGGALNRPTAYGSGYMNEVGPLGDAMRREGSNGIISVLSPGEMVLTPEQTRQYLSERAKPDRYVPNFADGGVVGQMPAVAPASGGNLAISVPVNIEGGGANKEEGDRIAQSLRAVIQSEIAQQLRQNGMISQILKRGR